MIRGIACLDEGGCSAEYMALVPLNVHPDQADLGWRKDSVCGELIQRRLRNPELETCAVPCRFGCGETPVPGLLAHHEESGRPDRVRDGRLQGPTPILQIIRGDVHAEQSVGPRVRFECDRGGK